MVKELTKKNSLVDFIKIAMDNWNRASVMQGAAEMAYFLLLSLIPILLVVANIIPLLPFETAEVFGLMEQAFPPDINEFLMPIVEGYLESAGGGSAISIGLLAAIWSASKVFNTLRRVLDQVYGTTDQKNFIIARLLSLAVMIAILLVVASAVFIFVFGEQIFALFDQIFGVPFPFGEIILSLRWVVLPLILLVVGIIIYDFVPNHHIKWTYALPGAIFMTIGLFLMTQFFSLITRFMGGDAVTNQTLGGFIVLMLFLYISNTIILLGALVNSIYFELKEGQSVYDYEQHLQKQEKIKESDWKGYPDEEEVVLLKRKLYKIN